MRILVIEDHADILANISEYFTLKGCEVTGALDGVTGLHLAMTGKFDAIILDVMLPGMDGNRVCQKLRSVSRQNTPILMLTARDELEDRLTGFSVGADDYIIKPFALSELFARVETVSRRSAGVRKNVLQVHDLTFDLDSLEVKRAGKLLKLNPTTLVLLELLMRKSPAIVKRREFELALWGQETPDSDSLRTGIYMLRRTIDKTFDVPLLHTVHSMGYKLQAPSGGEASIDRH
ncbi:response regulator transcription factor [Pseudomonas sp. CFBP 8770]|uniref:response regulator transcription factor n=1 Tax=unclassified Pseudomonas TaxID=196821 RepID=UPI001783DF8F|nr:MULTISPECIES: response regulator transcription factor [unclassified Pseudomonas]MBD8472899.1 response regulator transcription factor [Pseudomonas sp. CFBP 8773]MBD8645998.1 response regulator transcription factor [Pseudomonas sp. CFBP 8770]